MLTPWTRSPEPPTYTYLGCRTQSAECCVVNKTVCESLVARESVTEANMATLLIPETQSADIFKRAVVRSSQALILAILAGEQVWFNRDGEALDPAVFPWAAQGLDLPVPQPVP